MDNKIPMVFNLTTLPKEMQGSDIPPATKTFLTILEIEQFLDKKRQLNSNHSYQ